MKTKINIGIAEDHSVLRQGYVTFLKNTGNFNILFDVSNGKEVIERLKTCLPDILLLDLQMELIKGQEVLQYVKGKYPKLNVIVISNYFKTDNVVECINLGAKAFLRKEHNIDKIIEAINTVYEKGIYFDTEVSLMLVEEINTNYKKSQKKVKVLSEHQIEVLKLICTGYTSKAAAKVLGIEETTVTYHRGNIMRKTNSKNLHELIQYAIKNNYINKNN